MAEEAICVLLVGSGSGQEDEYASVISARKWSSNKRQVIDHIKARSKHSLYSFNRWHLKTSCILSRKLISAPEHAMDEIHKPADRAENNKIVKLPDFSISV